MSHRPIAVTIVLLFVFSTLGSFYVLPAKAAQTFPPRTGTTNEAVITVDFPASNLYLQSSHPYLGSLDGQVKYYWNVSYGALTIKYTVFGPFHLPQTEIYYGHDSGSTIDVNKVQFICDSLQAADSGGVPFSNFQHITIVHAGPGQESYPHNTDDIYSSWVGFSPACPNIPNASQITRVIVVSETSPIGTFCHEFGHDNGLPDIYDLTSGSVDDYVGPWSLMAAGNWLGTPSGSSPGSFDSWSKTQLGWINPLTITNATANVTIGPLELPNQSVYAVKIPLTSTTYYLLEARRRVGVDTAIPSEGVLVLLIDESKVGSNGFVSGVVLVEPHPNPDLNNAPLQIGQSFADPQSRVFIKVTSQYGLGYKVQITSHMLFVTMLGPLQVSATQTVSYNILVTDERNNTKSGILVTLSLDGKALADARTDLAGNVILRVTFNWTDLGLHTILIQTQAISNYIDGSQKATLQVVLPTDAYPLIAAALIVPVGVVLLRRRNSHNNLPSPNQWESYPAQMTTTGYCAQCGQPIAQGSAFCMFCGTRFT